MSSLIDRPIFITADTVGTETGGGKVTYHESKALFDLSSNRIVNDRDWLSVLCHNYTITSPDPWRWDDAALEYFRTCTQPTPKLVHFYAGTFSRTIEFLKKKGTRISYTAAAHSIEKSKKAHEMVGIPFNYSHLTNPQEWERYVRGYLDADLLICPSTHSANVMRGYGYTKPIRVIPHGVDVPDRAKLSPCPERFRVGYLGSYGCDKFWWNLLAAWKQLCWTDATLVFGGRDSKSDFVTSFIKSHEISNVECVGWVDSITDFYNRISLYVQPSLCLLPGSVVYSSTGITPIEDLKHGDRVLTKDGTYKEVIEPLKRRYSGEMVSFRTIGINVAVSMTPSHRVLAIRRGLGTRKKKYDEKVEVYQKTMSLREETKLGARKLARLVGVKESTVNGWIHYGTKPEGRGPSTSATECARNGTLEWVPASSIENGDIVVIPRVKTVIDVDTITPPKKVVCSHTNKTKALPETIELDTLTMRLFGYYVSEGCASESSVIFCFHKEEKNYMKEVQIALYLKFGLASKLVPHREKNSATVTVYSSLLMDYLVENFGKGAHSKTIPMWVIFLPNEKLEPFIQGVWRGDGSIFRTKQGVWVGSYSTVSKSLAYQMFVALVRLGYMPKMNVNETRGYSVNLTGRSLSDFAKNVMGVQVPTKERTSSRTHIDDDFYYMPVTEVNRIAYQGEVYNLEVEDNHCYAAPFIVHNSEGFGIEVLEAMAHERPVLCSTGAGAADVVPESWTYEPEDLNELVAKLQIARQVMEYRSDLFLSQWRLRAEKYSWDKVRKLYVEAWKELLS